MENLVALYPYLQPYEAILRQDVSTYNGEEVRFTTYKAQDDARYPDLTMAFPWTDTTFHPTEMPVMYEIWPMEGTTWRWIEKKVLPYILQAGYNTLLLTPQPKVGRSTFPVSCKNFGTPQELQSLVNTAHGMGLRVIMEASCFMIADSTDATKGILLNYLRRCLELYHMDGFFFAGVSHILYKDHAVGVQFNTLDLYFSANVNREVLLMLRLANRLVHTVRPGAITIAEDVSGMPGIADPLDAGGVGFDFRVAMGVPTLWHAELKKRDEEWVVQHLWNELERRTGKTIATVENHVAVYDGREPIMKQMVGDASLSIPTDSRVERALALQKLIRLVTITAAGEGLINTAGTEGGYLRWEIDDNMLDAMQEHGTIHGQLTAFDKALLNALRYNHVLGSAINLRRLHNDDHVIAYNRGNLLFVCNFNPTASFQGYGFPVEEGKYKLLVCTDSPEFGGKGRVPDKVYETFRGRVHLNLPSRTGLVLAKID